MTNSLVRGLSRVLRSPLRERGLRRGQARLFSAREVRTRLRLEPSTDARTAAVHAAAGQVGAWSALLSRAAARDLGRSAARLPTVLFWYRQGLSSEEIGRRLAPFASAWDGDRAIDATCALIAALLNRCRDGELRRGSRSTRPTG